jgi:Tol biopolymer transport system component
MGLSRRVIAGAIAGLAGLLLLNGEAAAGERQNLIVTAPGGDIDLQIVRPDGSLRKRFDVDAPREPEDPYWNPSKRWIIFDNSHNLFKIRFNGTDLTRLTHGSDLESNSAWSPTGGRIAYVRFVQGDDELKIMNSAGTGAKVIIERRYILSDPTWSPDGSAIAFVSNRGIEIVRLAGRDVRTLVGEPGEFNVHDPAWSPDGRRIAFTRTFCGEFNCQASRLVKISPQGKHRKVLVSTYAFYPAWSPSGGRLVYEDRDTGLSVVRRNGSHEHQIRNNADLDFPLQGSWLPDW